MHAALRFAALRAEHSGGRTALLKVLEPVEFAHFGSINTLMEQEAREEAEAELQRHAATVQRISGRMPSLYLRKGKPIDELLKLIEEEKEHLSILVLASGTGKEGPGPLISQLAGKLNRRLRIPLTIVPGSLTDDEIDRLS
jgi:nucleotide-binding universal stress UspA family protein